MKDNIIKHLEGGGTVVVDGVWHFKGLYMECTSNMESEYCCCEEDYEDYDEVWTAILDFSDSDMDIVSLS